MIFNTRARREEQERQNRELLEKSRKQKEQLEEFEKKELERLYELYKNDEGVLNLVKTFLGEETKRDSPKGWILNSVGTLESCVENDDKKVHLNAFVQVGRKSIGFLFKDVLSHGYAISFKNCGFANIEDPIKQKAILLVFGDYFKTEAQSIYLSKELMDIDIEFCLEKIYTYNESQESGYTTIGIADEDFLYKMEKSKVEHDMYPNVKPINAKIRDGAVITVTNNQPNVLRQL